MAGNADDVAQVEKLEELESLFAHHVQLDVNLQPRALARDMRERGFSMRPKSDDASRRSHVNVLSGKLLGGLISELPGNLLGRVRPGELVRIGRVAQSLDFPQFLAALKQLVGGFKFQQDQSSQGLLAASSR